MVRGRFPDANAGCHDTEYVGGPNVSNLICQTKQILIMLNLSYLCTLTILNRLCDSIYIVDNPASRKHTYNIALY